MDVELPGSLSAGAFDLRQSGPGTFWAYQHDATPPALLRLDATGEIVPVALAPRGDLDPDVTTNGGVVVVSDVDPSGRPVVYLVDPATSDVTHRLELD